MEQPVQVSFAYTEDQPTDPSVVDFFKGLPGAETRWKTSDRMPIRLDADQIITWLGSAVLSSATLAACIKAWIKGRRTKLVIRVKDKDKNTEVVYEGPNIRADAKQIQETIDALAALSRDLQIYTPRLGVEDQDVGKKSSRRKPRLGPKGTKPTGRRCTDKS